MTEAQLRAKYVEMCKSYIGSAEGSAKHHEIIDTYNTISPLPVGYKLQYDDEWCAGYVSAMAQLCGFTSFILPECSCTRMCALYDAVGGKKPSSYSPKAGDLIIYDWDPSGNNGPEHVGVVTANDGTNITVLEGNKSNTVEYRYITTSYEYIYCFLAPDYASQATGDTTLTFVTGNRYLTTAEMKTNALYIWDYLGSRGWTRNAVAGMLGNMQTESTINPGIWQGLNVNVGPAFGLVQWDPYTKYTEWCEDNGLEPSHMDSALKRIEYELENGLQYYKTDAYPLTFKEFKVSTKSANYLAMAFLANYERPADPDQPTRGTQAEYWYEVLAGHTPGSGGSGGGGSGGGESDDPEPGWKPTNRKKLSLLLLIASAKRGAR